MKKFLDKDFLLKSETAKILYHQFAEKTPIYDYHCHLSIKEIYEDRHFDSITDLWLVDGCAGDHYKWRAMRNNGVDEHYITGNASKEEKFFKWAETIPYAVGNPLYHWTHLELQRYFDIHETLSLTNAKQCYDKMNEFLKTHGARSIIEMSNVKALCTTDDPIDDLRYHKLLALDESFKVKVYPAYRPDKAMNIDWNTFIPYIKKLSEVVGYEITNLYELEKALLERVEFFHEANCRIADHSLEVVLYEKAEKEEVNEIVSKALKGEILTKEEVAKYKGYMLVTLGRAYSQHGWVQQYHIKALRNNCQRMMEKIGPDTGFDSINDGPVAENLSKILNELDLTGDLPKTILYSLNPSDNELLATLAFCFTQSNVPGKMQLGSAWWFLDQKDGMEKQITALSNLGLLSRFVGMLTDSRSFLSYTRHEYFRRVLCNKLGELVENGEYPNDIEFLGQMVENICYNNAKAYFDSNR